MASVLVGAGAAGSSSHREGCALGRVALLAGGSFSFPFLSFFIFSSFLSLSLLFLPFLFSFFLGVPLFFFFFYFVFFLPSCRTSKKSARRRLAIFFVVALFDWFVGVAT